MNACDKLLVSVVGQQILEILEEIRLDIDKGLGVVSGMAALEGSELRQCLDVGGFAHPVGNLVVTIVIVVDVALANLCRGHHDGNQRDWVFTVADQVVAINLYLLTVAYPLNVV